MARKRRPSEAEKPPAETPAAADSPGQATESKSLAELDRRLLALGGERVARRPVTDRGEADHKAADLLARGQVFTLPVALIGGMPPNGCHSNAAELWSLLGGRCRLVTGYALGEGIWREHSWVVVDGKELYETTYVAEQYFGMELSREEACMFYMTRCRKKPKSVALRSEAGGRGARRPVQFNWSRHWSKKVAPYLGEELVQDSLDVGMRMLDKDWKRGDAPCELGSTAINRIEKGKLRFKRVVKGKLSWYQPLNRCHHIAFFSMAIGVLNYPDLDWRFVSGDRHTVPVGCDSDGNPRVVMDILLFDADTAEESIALAQQDFPRLRADPEVRETWDLLTQLFVARFVPALKARARELRQGRKGGRGAGAGRRGKGGTT